MSLHARWKQWVSDETRHDGDVNFDAISRRIQRRAPVGRLALLAALAVAMVTAVAVPTVQTVHLSVADAARRESPLELDVQIVSSRWPKAWFTAVMALGIGTAHAQAPQELGGFSSRRVSFEFKALPVHDFFRMVAEIGDLNVVVAPCVGEKTVDIRIKNVPLKLAVDAVTQQLGLIGVFQGANFHVTCSGVDVAQLEAIERSTSALPSTRVSLAVKEAPAEEVFEMLSTEQAPIVVDACVRGRPVTLRIKNAPTRDVAVLLAQRLHVQYVSEANGFRVKCEGAAP